MQKAAGVKRATVEHAIFHVKFSQENPIPYTSELISIGALEHVSMVNEKEIH